LVTSFLQKHVTEGKIEGKIELTGRGGRRRKQLLDGLKDKGEYFNLKWKHYVENSLWKKLQTCRKTDCRMNYYSIT